MKKRLLNGSHSALGYVGYLLGHRDSAEAMADPLVRRYLERLMGEEIAPLLPRVAGIDLGEYRATLLSRFGSDKVCDQLQRLCGRGSTKVPAYLLPSIVEVRRQGRPHELLNLAVAAWVRYMRGVDLDGREIAIKDPRLEELSRWRSEAVTTPSRSSPTAACSGGWPTTPCSSPPSSASCGRWTATACARRSRHI